ncbi:amidase [Rhodococcus sp. IEGM 1354]|jgi:Asp-tRNA(Asn)/Glu-tRNA(Gln) amidotransferase A subunit family amidase|uniref:amidase n=1 Tax=Nocardiaceae TaxID=85025 RepID=UPI00050CC8B8|nr:MULTISPECIES: amidase [Rhodococcus]KJV03814.1 putative amidase [Rhodococcus sp. PML026]MDI9932417.1 amidase [Rhodococcus sp. IEGM 1354]WQH30052.1 amidase [Rhodococcus fascians]
MATTVGPAAELLMSDAVELSGKIKRREVSCVETMTAYLDHIEAHNPTVNAIVALRDRDELMDEARERDQQLSDGQYLGWMHGFPHAVKDLSAARGLPFTSGSPIFADRIADADDLFVARVKAAGAIVIGKTNTPEFGFGSQTYNPVYGTTVSPYDTSRTAGGSSGGAAAALALRMLPVADGTDYMGSLRNPAAFNNVVGFRPSWGRIPEPGFIAQGAVAGPMGRSVTDVAHLLSTMAGPDANAPLGIDEDPEIFTRTLERSFRGARIAWVGDWNGHLATEPGVLDLCESSFTVFEDLGCAVESTVPSYDPAKIWDSFLTWRWWAQLGMADLYEDPRTRELMKPEMLWEMEHAVALTALDVTKAAQARNDWQSALTTLFETYDFVLAPTAQVFPFDKDQHWPQSIAGRPMDTYHRWMETVVPWTMTGVPAAAVPVGFDDRGLPMGVQIIGRHGADRAVLQLAYAYEQASRWVERVLPPALHVG